MIITPYGKGKREMGSVEVSGCLCGASASCSSDYSDDLNGLFFGVLVLVLCYGEGAPVIIVLQSRYGLAL